MSPERQKRAWLAKLKLLIGRGFQYRRTIGVRRVERLRALVRVQTDAVDSLAGVDPVLWPQVGQLREGVQQIKLCRPELSERPELDLKQLVYPGGIRRFTRLLIRTYRVIEAWTPLARPPALAAAGTTPEDAVVAATNGGGRRRNRREPHPNPEALLEGKTRVTVRLAAVILGLSERRVRQLIEDGQLQARGKGNAHQILVASLRRRLEHRKIHEASGNLRK